MGQNTSDWMESMLAPNMSDWMGSLLSQGALGAGLAGLSGAEVEMLGQGL